LVDDGTLSNIVPAMGMLKLPFIVPGQSEALKILNGGLGSFVRDAATKAGLHQFPGSWAGGMNQLWTARPVYAPADVRGLKIRITPDAIGTAYWKALGAVPTPVSSAEQYTALQTHLIDGSAATLAGITIKLYEVTKYISLTNHAFGGNTMLANNDAWLRLPADLRALVERHFEAARQAANDDMLKDDAATIEKLKAFGMVFNNVDREAFKKAIRDAGLYSQWKSSYGTQAWSLLERAVGRVS